ncbi:hypothetical protein BpHYR1_039540 [Brachionus plicatilis]|uniref:RNA-directed DNA polymerase from mobile element jockey-like n=1 Tax=Brachionus plicatilis TaxID=10195 RepID=A0A3M7SRV1_BRAPC|nr:hypothetical protein BpHYR1_039540 [Brachionus plicatilis]
MAICKSNRKFTLFIAINEIKENRFEIRNQHQKIHITVFFVQIFNNYQEKKSFSHSKKNSWLYPINGSTLNNYIHNQIPMEPFPTCLGHKLDPNLSFISHFNDLSTRLMPKLNIIRNLKKLKKKNKIYLCKTVLMALIRPHLDYLFIALSTSTQKS